MDMKSCYICSPYRGNVYTRLRNWRYARYLTRKAINLGYMPITPHLYITQVLNDEIPEERKKGLEVGMNILELCDYIMIGGRYGISDGMEAEINRAKELRKNIIMTY